MARKQTKQTPMQKAVAELLTFTENGTGGATAEQMLAVAEKYEVPVWSLEGLYLDACDRLANE